MNQHSKEASIMSNLKINCLGATFYVLGIRKKEVSVVSHNLPTWRYFGVSRRTTQTQSNVCKFSTSCYRVVSQVV